MRLAALDIGSNTIHVLVADVIRGKLEDVAHYVEMPELGAQVARTGAIGAGGGAALRALRKVLAGARKDGYDQLIACATEAVRRASDGRPFARRAGEVAGVPVRIISARREAELSFLGAASRHASRREWALVDLGGASTEVGRARGRERGTSAALDIGSGGLASQFPSDPAQRRARPR